MGPLILLVDDAPDVGLIVRRLGQRAGQRVEVRPSAELGWEYLQATRPDLAILDVNLPGASGPDLCRQIRATPRLADLAVAILSQPDRPDDISDALDAGVDFVFAKDLLVEPAAWVQRIQEALTAPRPGKMTFHGQPALRGMAARLGEPVLAALLQRIARHEGAVPPSHVGEWLARFDGTAEANGRLADLIRQLERVLGRHWCARLWTVPDQEAAPNISE